MVRREGTRNERMTGLCLSSSPLVTAPLLLFLALTAILAPSRTAALALRLDRCAARADTRGEGGVSDAPSTATSRGFEADASGNNDGSSGGSADDDSADEETRVRRAEQHREVRRSTVEKRARGRAEGRAASAAEKAGPRSESSTSGGSSAEGFVMGRRSELERVRSGEGRQAGGGGPAAESEEAQAGDSDAASAAGSAAPCREGGERGEATEAWHPEALHDAPATGGGGAPAAEGEVPGISGSAQSDSGQPCDLQSDARTAISEEDHHYAEADEKNTQPAGAGVGQTPSEQRSQPAGAGVGQTPSEQRSEPHNNAAPTGCVRTIGDEILLEKGGALKELYEFVDAEITQADQRGECQHALKFYKLREKDIDAVTLMEGGYFLKVGDRAERLRCQKRIRIENLARRDDKKFMLIVIGDGGVGKSSVLQQVDV